MSARECMTCSVGVASPGLGGLCAACAGSLPGGASGHEPRIARPAEAVTTAAKVRDLVKRLGRSSWSHGEDCPHYYCGSDCEDEADAKGCDEAPGERCELAAHVLGDDPRECGR